MAYPNADLLADFSWTITSVGATCTIGTLVALIYTGQLCPARIGLCPSQAGMGAKSESFRIGSWTILLESHGLDGAIRAMWRCYSQSAESELPSLERTERRWLICLHASWRLRAQWRGMLTCGQIPLDPGGRHRHWPTSIGVLNEDHGDFRFDTETGSYWLDNSQASGSNIGLSVRCLKDTE